MQAIELNKCLPAELTVESVDDLLYRIGLSFDSVKEQPKRNRFKNPYFILTIFAVYFAKELIVICLGDEDDFISIIFGDFVFLLGMKPHLSIMVLLFGALNFGTHLVYIYNYSKGIKPTFVKVLQMIAGTETPRSLNLSDEASIKKLCKLTKFWMWILQRNNNWIIPAMGLAEILIPYAMYTSWFETVVYGWPHSILLATWIHFSFSFLTNQFLVFFVLSFYLKVKINLLKAELTEMIRRKRFGRIRETLQSLDSLYSEIDEYNSTFWSKFLLVFWLTISCYDVILLYLMIYGTLNIIIKTIFIYASVITFSSFLFIIFRASSVNSSANGFYKVLNSLIIAYTQHNKHNLPLSRSNKLKLNSSIERVGANRVGFTCWKLFGVTYFRCYETFVLMSTLFLRIVDMKENNIKV